MSLANCAWLVLDECDEMLRMGFAEQVEDIVAHAPPPTSRTTLLWSATMPPWVHAMAAKHTNAPQTVDCVGADAGRLPATAHFAGVMVTRATRMQSAASAVAAILRSGAASTGAAPPGAAAAPDASSRPRVLVFTDTKVEAGEVAAALGSAVTGGVRVRAAALTGDLSQAAREEALRSFRAGTVNVLVATDVAARGLDIPAVQGVVHYHLPEGQEAFVHRSGRTARAGRAGTIVALLTAEDLHHWQRWQRELKFIGRITAPHATTPPHGAEGEGLPSAPASSSPLPPSPTAEEVERVAAFLR